jgi:hypothetical protein
MGSAAHVFLHPIRASVAVPVPISFFFAFDSCRLFSAQFKAASIVVVIKKKIKLYPQTQKYTLSSVHTKTFNHTLTYTYSTRAH